MSASYRVELSDVAGAKIVLPDGRPTLVAFGKRDCPTCLLAFPVFRALHESYRNAIDFAWIAQDEDGGAEWSAEAGNLPILDDRALDATCRFDPEAVPTLFFIGADGQLRGSWAGFVRREWRALSDRLANETERLPAPVSWETLPELRPGCGSRHLDPTVAARLEMPPGAERLSARRLSLAEGEDAQEFLAARGLADGLPVVPPTPARVLAMLSGTRMAETDIVATVPPNLVPVNVEKVAINAVMAGCLPAYMPTLIAALRAVCSESFNLHGVLATTFFSSPILIVNGPVRDAIGIGYGGNCLGQGHRANLSIGRAVQLIVQNVGGGRPGGIDRAVLGQPGKTSFCFGEHEARSRWEPLHVERGFAAGASTVTAFAGSGPVAIVDQLSRSGRSLAVSYGRTVAASMHPKLFSPDAFIVVPPEHVDTFARDGLSKDDVREVMLEASQRPARSLMRDETCAEGTPDSALQRYAPDEGVPKFSGPENIHFVVAGGEAGKFAALLQGWPAGALGSSITTVAVDES